MLRYQGLFDAFGAAKLGVVGDVMLDRFVFGQVDRISPEAPVPIVRIERTETMLGGAGNVARGIARLGGQVTLIGVAGLDEEGRLLAALFADENRLQPRLVSDANTSTVTKTRYVSGGQQLLRADRDPPVVDTAIETRLTDAIASLSGIRGIVCSDYAKGAVSTAVFRAMLQAAQANDSFVIVDPKRPDLAFYAGATIITPNSREAAAATGILCDSDDGTAAAASAIMAQTRCKAVIITRGSQGLTILHAGNAAPALHLPAQAREVYNVAGAGDTFVATLAVALAAGGGTEDACRLANIAAGLAVTKITTAAVTADELARASEMSDLIAEHDKVVALDCAGERVKDWRARGEAIVFTNGCFDLLHPGHLSLLRHAKAQGRRLVVGLNADASVRRLKGEGRPLQTETARAMVLAAIEGVDLVVIFADDTPLALIEALCPDVLVKGADYREDEVVGGAFVQARGGRVVLAPTLDGHSTSRTVEAVRLSRKRDASRPLEAVDRR